MADPCTTYGVNTVAVTVTANSRCNRIEVRENSDTAAPPTADLVQYRPASSATPVKVFKGTSAIFTRAADQPMFSPGEAAGAIATSSGSITVAQLESWEI